ncbi:hypothetical protein HED60_05340 [Planctomycetales bacterium ZRK34]|nr:hypothetical protein HED60_05340 [Planctomycetales bacterium ZRK34]
MTRYAATMMMTILLATVALAAGCQAPAYVLSNVLPRPKIPAVFEPPDQPTVVLVDDPHHLLPNVQLVSLIAGRAGDDLKENDVISQVVPHTLVADLRAREADFGRWPIDHVGKNVGAKQVIYVLIEGYDMLETDTSAIYRPTAAVRVKIIDVATGRRLFPQSDSLGYPVTVQKYYRDAHDVGVGDNAIMARQLADRVGEDIALLFYEHKQREVGSGFQD